MPQSSSVDLPQNLWQKSRPKGPSAAIYRGWLEKENDSNNGTVNSSLYATRSMRICVTLFPKVIFHQHVAKLYVVPTEHKFVRPLCTNSTVAWYILQARKENSQNLRIFTVKLYSETRAFSLGSTNLVLAKKPDPMSQNKKYDENRKKESDRELLRFQKRFSGRAFLARTTVFYGRFLCFQVWKEQYISISRKFFQLVEICKN